ncbi:hypothetical protein [Azospirillum canadense]|uniref:hypothetical protein n=1 Tax=Azospirillum canadense TaxID=403962 RepID=UPI00222807C0|nr:hypothetical protein [Azospirillum canadense]MCW2240766.1 hypothetical protein [Azospirillum canadense]
MSNVYRGTPDDVSAFAKELRAELTAVMAEGGPPPGLWDLAFMINHVVGSPCWDILPGVEAVGALRIVWRGENVPLADARYLWVIGADVFVEGELPEDPRQRSVYLEIRRRYRDHCASGSSPRPGSPEVRAAHAFSDDLAQRVATASAALRELSAETGSATRH